VSQAWFVLFTLRFSIAAPIVAREQTMNAKLFFKTVFLIAILLLLVIMGMNTRKTVELSLPPLLPKTQEMPAAIMYFGFFGVGVLTGTILTAGGNRGGSRAKSE